MRVLGYAGLIPFIFPLGLIVCELWFGIVFYHEMVPPHFASYMFITYSAVILSFMSGTLWAHGQQINEQYLAKCAVLLSNMLSLSAWCAVLMSYVAPRMGSILGGSFSGWVCQLIMCGTLGWWHRQSLLALTFVADNYRCGSAP